LLFLPIARLTCLASGRRLRARARLPAPDLSWALETLFVPKFYRGLLVGFVQRHDDRNAVRLLAECDRLEEDWNLSKLTR
jgi:hypothetical protein